MSLRYQVRGLVKLKKFKKSEKNSDCPDPIHPPAYPFFWNMYNEKKPQKNNISKKNKSDLTKPLITWPLCFLKKSLNVARYSSIHDVSPIVAIILG